uniref:Ribosome maturation factor RimP N-terminal domain-containing protein n=1 Tax=Paulinella chromatophora TaxID=39717 RepID=B1X3N5_PAUCH|nr:hypothetical protein PCC_0102 [Paulinella chromatophora]ACB42554.1 hypothetical protein PCC_0102 [Paulinella chromatophora]
MVSNNSLISNLRSLVSQVAYLSEKNICDMQLLANLVPITLKIQISVSSERDVSINDCTVFSRQVEEALDNSSLLKEAYILEVSSPGINEELINDRDFRIFRGFPVEVVVNKSKTPTNRREGLLLERDDDSILINIRGRIHRIPREDVISVHLIMPFYQS